MLAGSEILLPLYCLVRGKMLLHCFELRDYLALFRLLAGSS